MVSGRFAPYPYIFIDEPQSVCEDTDVRILRNMIYVVQMARKIDDKTQERIVRNEKAAGAAPAESTKASSKFYGVKSASRSGCDYS